MINMFGYRATEIHYEFIQEDLTKKGKLLAQFKPEFFAEFEKETEEERKQLRIN